MARRSSRAISRISLQDRGCVSRYGGEDRLTIIEDVIRAQQPDVVGLLEANSRSNAETLARGLGMHLAYGEANSEFAVAWLSRLPIERSQNHRMPALAKTLLEIEILWEGSPLSLFATHLAAGRKEEHEHLRVEEVRAILEQLRLTSGRPHLLVGDFNAFHPGDSIGEPPAG